MYCRLLTGLKLLNMISSPLEMLLEIKYPKDLSQESEWKNLKKNSLHRAYFIDTVSSVLPEKIKFFSEAEINCEIGNSVYDNSLKGTPASKIMRGNQKGVNITLNLLCGLEGVLWANTVQGASNSTQFLHFFGEAGKASNSNGNLALEFSDFIVMDNCSIHRFESGHISHGWHMQIGASIIYTPLVPPEFNAQLNLFSINLKLSRGRKNLDGHCTKMFVSWLWSTGFIYDWQHVWFLQLPFVTQQIYRELQKKIKY